MCPWFVVAKVGGIKLNSMKEFEVVGCRILLVNALGKLYAIEASCPHRGYALKFGSLSGKVLRCGFHYAEFNVEDGRVLREPVDGKGTRGLKSYPVKVEGENILVLLEE
jgi:nitrite reductase/ring-hydroxylating ferredoxin subunit